MREIQLTDDQTSVVVGSLLGDGYLDRTTMGYSLRFHHGIRQKDYIDWKYSMLRNIVNSPPKVYGTRVYFRTVSHPYLADMRRLFYKNGNKIIPQEFLREAINPFLLAVWLMDDGTNELGSGRCVKINSQSFTFKEHEFLCELFRNKFGLMTNINRDRTYFRIRFYKQSMPKLIEIVKPHILPSMFYKLSP